MEFVLIALTIIGGIVGTLKNKSNQAEPGKRGFKPGETVKTRSGDGSSYQQSQTGIKDISASVGEQQEMQMEELKKRMNTQSVDDTDENVPVNSNLRGSKNRRKKQVNTALKKDLNQQGFVNGFIMAEVLGKPRALRPYHSIIQERRK